MIKPGISAMPVTTATLASFTAYMFAFSTVLSFEQSFLPALTQSWYSLTAFCAALFPIPIAPGIPVASHKAFAATSPSDSHGCCSFFFSRHVFIHHKYGKGGARRLRHLWAFL